MFVCLKNTFFLSTLYSFIDPFLTSFWGHGVVRGPDELDFNKISLFYAAFLIEGESCNHACFLNCSLLTRTHKVITFP